MDQKPDMHFFFITECTKNVVVHCSVGPLKPNVYVHWDSILNECHREVLCVAACNIAMHGCETSHTIET